MDFETEEYFSYLFLIDDNGNVVLEEEDSETSK